MRRDTFTITFNILFQIMLINKGKYYNDCDKDDGTVRMRQWRLIIDYVYYVALRNIDIYGLI